MNNSILTQNKYDPIQISIEDLDEIAKLILHVNELK